MSTSVYPVRVDATLDPGLNRWLWRKAPVPSLERRES